jgi:DNA mismatch repair protein MLH1
MHDMMCICCVRAQKGDLAILCHRHTTSKLACFEDLATMSTLGFRGEALCSISFVSSMSVTTMTPGALHGWRVAYKVICMVGLHAAPESAGYMAACPGSLLGIVDG